MKQLEAVFVFPPVSKSDVVTDLVNLTEYLVKNNFAPLVSGFLGREFGYGCDFKNDVFEMSPYYWGDCTCDTDNLISKLQDDFFKRNKHVSSCFTLRYNRWEKSWKRANGDPHLSEESSKKFFKDSTHFRKIHRIGGSNLELEPCTCDFNKKEIEFNKTLPYECQPTCLTRKPNFVHFNSGMEIRWYKYLGRSMEYNKKPSKKLWNEIYLECTNSVA